MQCVICKSEDVPISQNTDDSLGRYKEKAGIYLSKMHIPFEIGVRKSPRDISNLFRVRLHYPANKPLCKKCRKKILIESLGRIEEGD